MEPSITDGHPFDFSLIIDGVDITVNAPSCVHALDQAVRKMEEDGVVIDYRTIAEVVIHRTSKGR